MILLPGVMLGQKSIKVNKYTVGVEMDLGHTFPHFESEQDRWKATFYPTYGINPPVIYNPRYF